MGVKLSKLMMRQHKDGVYRMSRYTVAKHVAFLEFRLMDAEQLANERGEKRDILYNENAALKRENKMLKAHHKRLWLAIAQAQFGKLDFAYVDELIKEAEEINPIAPLTAEES